MALLLRHLGRGADADRVDAAVSADIESNRGAARTTGQIGGAIAAALR